MRSFSVPAHAGTAAGAAGSMAPSFTSTPTAAWVMLFAVLHDIEAGVGVDRAARTERCVRRRAVAFGDDVAALQHDERERDPQLGRPPEDLVDSILDRHEPRTLSDAAAATGGRPFN